MINAKLTGRRAVGVYVYLVNGGPCAVSWRWLPSRVGKALVSSSAVSPCSEGHSLCGGGGARGRGEGQLTAQIALRLICTKDRGKARGSWMEGLSRVAGTFAWAASAGWLTRIETACGGAIERRAARVAAQTTNKCKRIWSFVWRSDTGTGTV